jgi:outer membrane usher protein
VQGHCLGMGKSLQAASATGREEQGHVAGSNPDHAVEQTH